MLEFLISSRFVIAPLDVVKIRLQLQSLRPPKDASPNLPPPQLKYRGIYGTFKTIVKEEGPLALWKGNWPAEFLYLTYGAVQFWSHGESKRLFQYLDAEIIHIPKPIQSFLSGAIAGSAATIITYPFDLLRTRFAVQGQGDAKVYTSMYSAVRQILETEGVRGLYLGLGPSLLQIMPYMGLMFGAYDGLKKLSNRLKFSSSLGFSISQDLLCGGLAGIISKIGVFPFDTVRKRMQIQGPTREQYIIPNLPRYSRLSTTRIAASMFKHEGLRSFYRGMLPGLLKAGPSSAVTFLVYEECRRYCERS
ncbi:mitochondrial deoxynucleotide carrier [Paraphysoderma sedebokerense]|nr:mitochondrial deoxynucleotide carrier [Paraphysoderma sedebokerense]